MNFWSSRRSPCPWRNLYEKFRLLRCCSARLRSRRWPSKANEAYKTQEGRENVAEGLAIPDRDERQRPRDIVDAMDLKPGASWPTSAPASDSCCRT